LPELITFNWSAVPAGTTRLAGSKRPLATRNSETTGSEAVALTLKPNVAKVAAIKTAIGGDLLVKVGLQLKLRMSFNFF
jgi:hypothetical protein